MGRRRWLSLSDAAEGKAKPASRYLALNLPGFGDGGQVARRHHHGPADNTAALTSEHLLKPERSGWTYMTISLRVVSSIMYLVQSFQLSYVFDWSTIFWNMVLFLLTHERRQSGDIYQWNDS